MHKVLDTSHSNNTKSHLSKMSSAFDTVSRSYNYLQPPPYRTADSLTSRSQDSLLPRRSRSPNFLTSVKDLVHRSHSPLRSQTRNGDTYRKPSGEESYNASHRRTMPLPGNEARPMRSSARRRREYRENIPSMIDYLTLSQLENVWQRHDTYIGCVYAPQRVAQQSAVFPSQRQEATLENPYMDLHSPHRRDCSYDERVWSRRAAASATRSHWR